MPNHATSRVIVNGSKRELDRFKKTFIRKDDDGDLFFDFNVAIPEPAEIRDTENDSLGTIGYNVWHGDPLEVDQILTYPWIKEAGVKNRAELKKFLNQKSPEYKIHADRYKQNMKKYGVPNSYEWHVRYWGTKWNSYAFSWAQPVMGPKDWSPKPPPKHLEFLFDTAWSVPEPVFHRAAEMFPDLDIDTYSYEGGNGFSAKGFFREGAGSIVYGDATDEMYEKVYGAPPEEPGAP